MVRWDDHLVLTAGHLLSRLQILPMRPALPRLSGITGSMHHQVWESYSHG
jgi:hypothetical protein